LISGADVLVLILLGIVLTIVNYVPVPTMGCRRWFTGTDGWNGYCRTARVNCNGGAIQPPDGLMGRIRGHGAPIAYPMPINVMRVSSMR
jgi:hypothetical protein